MSETDRVNTSGYISAHYETDTERLERENREMKQRIAELEAALTSAKTECERQKEQIAELYSREDRLKTELTEERLKKFAPLLPSEMCNKHHIQNCHCCERMDCGDNTSEAKKRIAELEAASNNNDSTKNRCDTCKYRYATDYAMRQVCSDCVERASDNYVSEKE